MAFGNRTLEIEKYLEDGYVYYYYVCYDYYLQSYDICDPRYSFVAGEDSWFAFKRSEKYDLLMKRSYRVQSYLLHAEAMMISFLFQNPLKRNPG